MQTSNALNKCCMGNSYFAGSAEQVECNKLLLIACKLIISVAYYLSFLACMKYVFFIFFLLLFICFWFVSSILPGSFLFINVLSRSKTTVLYDRNTETERDRSFVP